MVALPDEFYTTYESFVDDFIDENFGINCKIIYPSTKINCVNCVSNPISRSSGNVYRHGGPAPFSFGKCPVCDGSGFKESENFDVIKLKVLYRTQDFVKIADVIVPDGTIQVIGMMSNLPKYMRATEIIVNSDMQDMGTQKYSRLGDWYPHGLRKRRYFVGFMKRS